MNYWKSGSWNVICDRCGVKTKATEVKTDWQGFVVCTSCYETRHPQDFIRAKQDKIVVPFTRPRPTDVFISVDYVVTLSCTPTTSIGESDRGAADCARADIKLQGDLI